MTQYGEILGIYNPIHAKIYEDFDSYFNHPIMTKMYDMEGHSVYMTKTYCLLSTECRYILAIVAKDNMPNGTRERLLDLPWVSFQTRTLPSIYQIQSHSYTPARKGPLHVKIHRTNATQEAVTYECNDLPIVVTLLNVKQSSMEYQKEGHLIAALETFQTIITLI